MSLHTRQPQPTRRFFSDPTSCVYLRCRIRRVRRFRALVSPTGFSNGILQRFNRLKDIMIPEHKNYFLLDFVFPQPETRAVIWKYSSKKTIVPPRILLYSLREYEIVNYG